MRYKLNKNRKHLQPLNRMTRKRLPASYRVVNLLRLIFRENIVSSTRNYEQDEDTVYLDVFKIDCEDWGDQLCSQYW